MAICVFFCSCGFKLFAIVMQLCCSGTVMFVLCAHIEVFPRTSRGAAVPLPLGFLPACFLGGICPSSPLDKDSLPCLTSPSLLIDWTMSRRHRSSWVSPLGQPVWRQISSPRSRLRWRRSWSLDLLPPESWHRGKVLGFCCYSYHGRRTTFDVLHAEHVQQRVMQVDDVSDCLLSRDASNLDVDPHTRSDVLEDQFRGVLRRDKPHEHKVAWAWRIQSATAYFSIQPCPRGTRG